jgi:hypothetical protein
MSPSGSYPVLLSGLSCVADAIRMLVEWLSIGDEVI